MLRSVTLCYSVILQCSVMYTYTHTYTYTYTCTYTYTYMCICVCVYLCICVCVYMCNMCICVLYIYMYMCKCVYVYMVMYMYINDIKITHLKKWAIYGREKDPHDIPTSARISPMIAAHYPLNPINNHF
jgi:hypothetical protein